MQEIDSKKNSGFGTAGIIITIVAVLVAGLIGLRVYDANSNRPSDSANQSSGSSSNNQTDATIYLDIRELGVKIKLDEKTKNVSYVVAQAADDESVYIIDSTIKAVDDANEYCKGPTAGMVGLLNRSKDVYHWGETALVVDNIKSFKVRDYYYVFRGPQAECSQDSAISQERAAHQQDFVNVLKTIQPN